MMLVVVAAMATASHMVAEEECREAEEQTEEQVRRPAMTAATVALHEAAPAGRPRVARVGAAYGRLVHCLDVHLSATHLMTLHYEARLIGTSDKQC